MGRRNRSTSAPLSARSLLKAAKEEHELGEKATKFLAYVVSRLPEGVPYLAPKNPLQAERVDSLCHGSGVGAEYLVPTLVSAGWFGLKHIPATDSDPPSTQPVFKTKAFDEFKALYIDLEISYTYKKTLDDKRNYMITRGKIKPEYLAGTRAVLTEDPMRLPSSTDRLTNEALDIAKDIQTKTLKDCDGLYDMLGLERQGAELPPTNGRRPLLEITNDDAMHNGTRTSPDETAATAVVTPSNNAPPTNPTVTPTGVITPNGFLPTNSIIEIVKLAHSFAASGDAAGAQQVLQPFQNATSIGDNPEQWYNWKIVPAGDKRKVQVAIPETFVLNRSDQVNAWKASHEQMKFIKGRLGTEIACFPPSAKRVVAASVALTGKLSGPGMEILVHGVARALFDLLGIEYTPENLLNILPCKAAVETWIQELACSQLFVCSVIIDEEDGDGICLTTDKADEKVKKGMSKTLTKWSRTLATDEFPDGQVFFCLLDSDATGSKTEEGAAGVEHSLHKLPNWDSCLFDIVASDSGGGFVIENKKAALKGKNFCDDDTLVVNCCCHNFQLTGTVPMKHLYESGTVGIRSMPQCVFLGHLIQEDVLGRRLSRESLDELWEKCQIEMDEDEDENRERLRQAAEHPDMLLKKPDDSRWLYTAFAVDRLERNFDLWYTLADKFLETKHTQTQRDIVSNFKSLLDEPEILVDLALTAGFFRGYFFRHFKFLQGVDPNIGKPGFLSFHIVVRVFLMLQDLDRLAGYRNGSVDEMKSFVKRVDAMPQGERESQHKKASDFFAFAKAELLKMFARWINTPLFFLSAFGEVPTGKLIARYLLSSEAITMENATTLLLPREDTVFESPMHGCEIDLRKLCKFFVVCVDQESLNVFKQSFHFKINRRQFTFIATAANVWNRAIPETAPHRASILKRYGAIPSNTQFQERANKNHNMCASYGRGEMSVNARMTVRSLVTDVSSVTTVDGKRAASSGRTHVETIFERLADFEKLEQVCQSRLSQQEVDNRRRHIKEHTFNPHETFEEKCYQEKKQSIDLSVESVRVPYAAELRTGYDASSYRKGEVQYGKLRTRHVQVMKDELTARNIPFEAKDGIKKLYGRLKDKLRNDWILQNPGVDEKLYDDDKKKTMFFKPVTDINVWDIDIVQ